MRFRLKRCPVFTVTLLLQFNYNSDVTSHDSDLPHHVVHSSCSLTSVTYILRMPPPLNTSADMDCINRHGIEALFAQYLIKVNQLFFSA